MKYAVFGDVHANLEALEAILAHAESEGCTHYVCLGDIVGYNANPTECVELVQKLECPIVRGNHDEEVSRDTAPDNFNPLAAQALLWTRNELPDIYRVWLGELPLVHEVEEANFTIVHSTMDTPSQYGYVMNKFDAIASFSFQFRPVCFHGHTHVPRIFRKNHSVEELTESEVKIEPGMKYFINPGSVGQPRDIEWRAAYATYDIDAQLVKIHRVDWDLEKAEEKVAKAGLP